MTKIAEPLLMELRGEADITRRALDGLGVARHNSLAYIVPRLRGIK